MKQEAYENPQEILYTDPSYKNGIIIQIDENNEEVFKVTMPGLIYRTFKIEGFYQENTDNYLIESLQRINGTKLNGNLIKTSDIKYELNKAKKYFNKIEIKTNRICLHDELSESDIEDIILVGENDLSYSFCYKKAGKEAPQSFNSGYSSIMINLPKGNYEIYIKINDIYYDTETIVTF